MIDKSAFRIWRHYYFRKEQKKLFTNLIAGYSFMKNLLVTTFFILSTLLAKSQYSFTFNGQQYNVLKTSVFKDSTGKQYNYNEAMLTMMGGEYEVLPANPRDASKGFILSGITKEERLKRAMAAPKPAETTAFKTGKKFDSFSWYDMNDKLFESKLLKGKVLVIIFGLLNALPAKRNALT